MSYTEIFSFNKTGEPSELGEVNNAFRGAMAIWQILEKKYLEPLPKPMWMNDKDYKDRGYSRTSASQFDGDNVPHPLKPIWDLWSNNDVSRIDKIVLGTTFDKVVVMRENIKETLKAFEQFDGETSLKEQAKILMGALKDEDIIAVAWNQTSVNCDIWRSYNYDEESEESTPYNLLKQEDHCNLFEELN